MEIEDRDKTPKQRPVPDRTDCSQRFISTGLAGNKQHREAQKNETTGEVC